MKNIFDLYEENSTPANTTGMGNPMPASEECNGSEPIVGKKKAKCKKDKCNKIDEASILDIEDTLKTGDNIVNAIFDFANHLVDCVKQNENISYTEDEILELTNCAINNKAVSLGKPGEIIYDSKGFDNIKDRKKINFSKRIVL